MCDRSYPKKLAFQYLEDLKNEFERVNGNQIETAARPYAFIKFGMLMLYLHLLQYLKGCFTKLLFSLSLIKIHLFREQRNCTKIRVPKGTLLN